VGVKKILVFGNFTSVFVENLGIGFPVNCYFLVVLHKFFCENLGRDFPVSCHSLVFCTSFL
jgi:hypothetical protein